MNTRACCLALLLLLMAACQAKPPPASSAPTVTAAEAAAKRQACSFGPGSLASATLASDAPTGDQLPIDHIILVMQENRSFDHYFSQLPGADGPSPTATNPDANGNPVSRFHLTQNCTPGPSNAWDVAHQSLDNGKNDGFVVANGANGQATMGYYDANDLPYYYGLAEAFAVSDRHFCSVPGSTWPNRMYYFAGTSYGIVANNPPPDTDPSGNPYPNIFTELNAANVSWKFYADSAPTSSMFISTQLENQSHYAKQSDFWADAASGSLASVTFFETMHDDGGDGVDEHPPADVQLGQALMAKVVDAMMNSPNWKTSALFLTYDEHGGYYDHVAPPAACKPDDLKPYQYVNAVQTPAGYDFDQYGFRIPLIVVSPYAKRGYVSHHVTDHTSILRFVEARFNLPAMTKRDANAEPPYDLFDFQHPNYDKPMLPAAPVDSDAATQCATRYPPSTSGGF